MIKCKNYTWLLFSISFSFALHAQTPILEKNLYLKGITKRNTAIYKSQSASSMKVQVLNPFDIVYVYERPSGSGYYKVGPTPEEIIGYIKSDDLIEWNNRTCLLFTPLKGRQPALVFNNLDPIKRCIMGAEDFIDTNGRPHRKSIAMEPDEKRFAGQRYSMLLPILGKERISSTSEGRINAFNIGFLSGGSVPVDGPRESSKSPSSKVAELELMFLIDATGSMAPYISGSKQIVDKVTQRIARSREAGCRFGVTAYRDYADEYIYKQFLNLTRNSSKMTGALSSITAGGGGDAPEAVFDAFYGALTESSWHKVDNTLRVIILIGDASPHKTGAGNPKRLTTDDLVKKASEKKVRTIAVKIRRSSADEAGSSEFKRLAEGMTLGDKGTFLEVTHGGSLTRSFIDKTSSKIIEEIERLERMISVVTSSKDRIGTSIPFPTGTTSKDRAIILKNITIKPGSPRPIEFSKGWISEYDYSGNRLVNPYVYMTKDEFNLMMSYIKLVNETVVNPGKAMEGSFMEMIESSTGEELKGSDIASHYKKALNLPVKTDILRIPIKEVVVWGEERKAKMMKVIGGKINSLEKWGNNLDNWFEAPGRKGFQYTFVPVDMLP